MVGPGTAASSQTHRSLSPPIEPTLVTGETRTSPARSGVRQPSGRAKRGKLVGSSLPLNRKKHDPVGCQGGPRRRFLYHGLRGPGAFVRRSLKLTRRHPSKCETFGTISPQIGSPFGAYAADTPGAAGCTRVLVLLFARLRAMAHQNLIPIVRRVGRPPVEVYHRAVRSDSASATASVRFLVWRTVSVLMVPTISHSTNWSDERASGSN